MGAPLHKLMLTVAASDEEGLLSLSFLDAANLAQLAMLLSRSSLCVAAPTLHANDVQESSLPVGVQMVFHYCCVMPCVLYIAAMYTYTAYTCCFWTSAV